MKIFSLVIKLLIVMISLSGCSSLKTTIEHPNFSGIWEVVSIDEVIRPELNNPQYTDEALRRNKFYKKNFDEVTEASTTFCSHAGMPWTMLGRARGYTREIYQSNDRIVFTYEFMDMFRQIRLDETTFPENFPEHPQGYSIAHWEGNDLVIESQGFTSTSEASKFHRSDEARIIERWHLLQHPELGDTIEMTIEIHDPVFYKVPAYGRTLLKLSAKGAVVGGYNCPKSLWQDFIDNRLEELESAENL